MINILSIITDTNIGGAGNVLLNFMKNTDREEFCHTVIVPENAQLAHLLHNLGVNVVEVAGIADKSVSVRAFSTFKKIYKELQPDLIHTHASLTARFAAKLRCNKITTVHTRHCYYPQGKLKTSFPIKHIIGFANNRLSDRMIAISPAVYDNLVETGADRKKIVTMFNGVEPVRRLSDEEKSAARASLGINDGEFVCAAIARLVPEKGHQYILEAAGMLRDLPIRFIIAGEGPSGNELRATAESLGLTNCIFTGFVGDIASIINIVDLQLNASYGTEASSLSLMEGMSLGVPTAVSDYGGNPHIITNGENGIIVPKQDGALLAGAIRSLYEDSETLLRMGENALRIYNERFTAAIMAANIEQVYREALNVKC